MPCRSILKSGQRLSVDGIGGIMQQNIYDNDTFFKEYRALRETVSNYNDLLEQPAMQKLLPDVQNKSVLDLGCGFGNNCMDFVQRGAEKVVGVDLSKNMLALARQKNSSDKIHYKNMSMTEIAALHEKFDLIYSSLAFHYIQDLNALMCDVYQLLNNGGVLLFSQEHPVTTCSMNDENHYIKNERGEAVAYSMSHYAITGLRKTEWFVDGVERYHRTLAQVINAVSGAGFFIKKIAEPVPNSAALKVRPGLKKEFIKPSFLIVQAEKCSSIRI